MRERISFALKPLQCSQGFWNKGSRDSIAESLVRLQLLYDKICIYKKVVDQIEETEQKVQRVDEQHVETSLSEAEE